MLRTLMTGKLHRVTTTAAEVDYIGSCAIDQNLMDAADILPHEQIHLWNVNNGDRLVTYAIEAPRGSGIISVNGSAAHHAHVGDILILAAFGQFTETEAQAHKPKLVFVNQHNQIITKAEATALGVGTDPVPYSC
jgi:aspartate 1-decarboxylase